MVHVSDTSGQFRRIGTLDRARISFTIDGEPVEAFEGDTVLTALLTNQRRLRRFEFEDGWRAGFCLMGACQDCWICLVDGTPLRACTTPLKAGMALVTGVHDDA